MLRPLSCVFALALLSGCGGGERAADSPAPDPLQQACATLVGRSLGGAAVRAASVVPATGAVPVHCRVSAHIAPTLNFELRLPATWNGRLHVVGGGGYNGSIPPLEGLALSALLNGYASLGSDSGHQGDAFDASWVIGNAQAAAWFGHASIPAVTAAARTMLATALGRAPERAYFEGCSGGGREALMMAQRYPALFDGIVARAPAYDWTALMGAFHRNAQAVAVADRQLPPARLAVLAAAVRNACDAADGIADGIVSRPSACHFDPATLRCPGGLDGGGDCLSDTQLAAVAAVGSSASFDGGRYHYPGWPLTGQEDEASTWSSWITGGGNVRVAGQYLLQDTTVKSYLAADLAQDSLAYTPYDRAPAALAAMAALNDATNPDLRAFAAAGGKLLLWHGAADATVSPRSTVAYHEAVTASVGSATAESLMRLYVAPGVAHCGGGPGADGVDLLAPLDAWVRGLATPGTLTAVKTEAGVTRFSRPLCRYPQYPRYVGPAGNSAAAALATNYRCTDP